MSKRALKRQARADRKAERAACRLQATEAIGVRMTGHARARCVSRRLCWVGVALLARGPGPSRRTVGDVTVVVRGGAILTAWRSADVLDARAEEERAAGRWAPQS